MSPHNIINLEIKKSCDNVDNQLIYLINKFNNSCKKTGNIKFLYKSKHFELKIIDIADSNKINFDNDIEIVVHTAYEIIFNSADITIFNDFIKASLLYYNNNYLITKKNDDYISIYITSRCGTYFTYLGKKQKRNIDSIYLTNENKQSILNDIKDFIKPETKAIYNKLGITYKRIYLLEGIPGSGKTSLITGIASYFNFNMSIVSFTPTMTDVELINILRNFVDDANVLDNNKQTKSLLIFEDIDCIFKERKSNDENRNSITFSGLLNALDGIVTDEIICFITTNYKKNLDSALLRPGRIDYVMHFDYAVKEQIINIYKDFTNTQKTIQELDINNLSNIFYDACCSLNIKITTALLQQYLIKYIDKPQNAIDNIDEMKLMYSVVDVSKEADKSGLYC